MNKIHILRMLSFFIFLLLPISIILWIVDIIDIEHMLIINWTILLTEVILILTIVNITIRSIRNRDTGDISDNIVKISKGSFSEKKIRADTEIFLDDIGPTSPFRNCVFRIKLELKEFIGIPLFYIIRKCERNTCEQIANDDILLDTGKVHIFDIIVDQEEKLNFKFDKNVIVKSFSVIEFYKAW